MLFPGSRPFPSPPHSPALTPPLYIPAHTSISHTEPTHGTRTMALGNRSPLYSLALLSYAVPEPLRTGHAHRGLSLLQTAVAPQALGLTPPPALSDLTCPQPVLGHHLHFAAQMPRSPDCGYLINGKAGSQLTGSHPHPISPLHGAWQSRTQIPKGGRFTAPTPGRPGPAAAPSLCTSGGPRPALSGVTPERELWGRGLCLSRSLLDARDELINV